jgi:hypothetical protein
MVPFVAYINREVENEDSLPCCVFSMDGQVGMLGLYELVVLQRRIGPI